jgi:hypothetical protein
MNDRHGKTTPLFLPASAICRGVWLLALLVTSASRASAELPRDPDLAYAERVLHSAKAETDGPGVLAFIRLRTLSKEQFQHLADLVRRLGASAYSEREKATRELIAAGQPALPYLQQAIKDPDLEVSRRARRCIEKIRHDPTSHLMAAATQAAAQIVKARRPPGAPAVLLEYLPCINDEAFEDVWLDALRAVGWRDDRPDPVLLTALTHKRPICRAAAAHVLSRGPSAELSGRVVPLLADADPRVRYEAAAGLARCGEKKALPVLIALLADAPFSLACRAEYLLCSLADGQGPEETLGKDEATARRACRDAWQTWWRQQADRVDLTRLEREAAPRGLTLVCEYDGTGDGGRVWEWGQAGQPCWEAAGLEGPNDVQLLSDGRLLVAERHANRVTERDHRGKMLWEHRAHGVAIGCQRLSNGNTLIVTFHELYEVTREGQVVFRHPNGRWDFRHARKLPSGHVLYVTSKGQLVEMDGDCKQRIRVIRPADHADGAKYWASVEPLPNGRYLLALAGSNRVIEIDATGKIRWECDAPAPSSATRLRNGHTLIACFEDRCVLEVDRAGKEVSKQPLHGRPFVVRRH